MAVTNTIAGKPQTKPQQKTEITYDAGGETVNISPQLIRRYLVRGGGDVTDEEVMAFLSLCRFQHLNPFINDAYLIKYGQNSPATIVVGKDVFIKRARLEKDFAGFTAGIIVLSRDTGEVTEREGAFWMKDTEALLGGWARVDVKDFKNPFYASVALDDYIGKKKNGEISGQWSTKTATMIRKVALVQALRDAFPNLSGMYAAEERADDVPAEIMADAAEVPAQNPVLQAAAPAPQMAATRADMPVSAPVNTPEEIIIETPRAQENRQQATGQQYSFADDPEAALFGGRLQ